MAHWYKYAVVKFAAHFARAEKLNVGLIIFHDTLDVRIGRSLDKIKAITQAVDVDTLRRSLGALRDIDQDLSRPDENPIQRVARLIRLTAFEFSELGEFEALSEPAYEDYVNHLLATFVDPEPGLRKRSAARSKLFSSLRSELRKRRVLAREGEGIASHRVVLNWRVDEGLSAEFALQNGILHLAKTVDALSDTASLRRVIQDVAVSALVLEKARVCYGREKVRGRIIYSASAQNEALATPSLATAEHQGAELINWASYDDRRRFVDEISDLAHPLPLIEMVDERAVNASVEHRFRLN